MMMRTSSASTTVAATATFVDADTNSVVADNQVTFQADAGYNPAAADHSWICKEYHPVGSFDSQKTAVEYLKQYAVRQGFAISVSRILSIGRKRSFLTCSQENIIGDPTVGARQCEIAGQKGRLFIRSRDHE